ncbi:MAG: preprotein translocase subunit SecY [Acidobacteriota bacterium]|nr:preprotein translocase subunit SecY [Acidobacteriota bacterium]
MEKAIESVKNIFKIPDLRNRIFFTFGILALYRLGCFVLVPGIDKDEFAEFFKSIGNGMLDMANMFTGGALSQAAVFSLGIMPYITASIILQILQKSWPYLERLSKEGEQGRNKINRYTRYLTVGFAALQSWGVGTTLISLSSNNPDLLTIQNTWVFRLVVMITLTTGAMLIMWLGEKITEKGIGNGISLIIFASIVVGVPAALSDLFQKVQGNEIEPPVMVVSLLLVIVTIVFVVFFELGVRKIKIQYAKRATGTGQMSGGASYLPFKVNSAGVIPVIFSGAVLQLPMIVQGFATADAANIEPWVSTYVLPVLDQLAYGRPLSQAVFFVATMFFTFFYVDMLFNPKDTAENLKKHGGFIPGIRPGKETQNYIQGVLDRLTLWGGLYLSAVSIIPTWIMSGLQLNALPYWLGGDFFERILPSIFNSGTNVTLAVALGGTSLLILVSVGLDFVNQVENQLIMRKYDGFTSGSKKAYMRTRRYG